MMVTLKRLILVLLLLQPFTAEGMRARVLKGLETVGMLLCAMHPDGAYLLGKKTRKYADTRADYSQARKDIAAIAIAPVEGFLVYELGRCIYSKVSKPIFKIAKQCLGNRIPHRALSGKEKIEIQEIDNGFNVLVKWTMLPVAVLSASQFLAGYFSDPNLLSLQSGTTTTTTYSGNFVNNIKNIKKLFGEENALPGDLHPPQEKEAA